MTTKAVIGSICMVIGNAVEAAETNFLRRTKLEGPSDPIGASADEVVSRNRKGTAEMASIWETTATATKMEWDAERLLQWSRSSRDFSMSMPVRPPAGPIPRPTTPPSPDTQPTNSPNPQPTPPDGDCLQGRTREEYIFDLLVPVTDGALLNDPSTPQGMAFDYLANEDPYLSDPCVSSTIEQRYGLTTLYYALAGPGWQESQGWLGDEQECLWFGVNCVGGDSNAVTNITLREYGNVEWSRRLVTNKYSPPPPVTAFCCTANNNLIGSIPDEIQTFEMIERIDFFSNAISGTLPTTISALTRLILLDVEQNLLTGPAFPTQLFELPVLLAYRASDNFLTGSIPSEIGQLSLLQQLWLATNQISGTIPTELASCTDLEFIFLYENGLTGSLPMELGALTKLEELRLYKNTISDAVPVQLFAATNLEALRLELNFLTGTIPTEIGALTLLTDLQFNVNSFSGTIPTEIGNLIHLGTSERRLTPKPNIPWRYLISFPCTHFLCLSILLFWCHWFQKWSWCLLCEYIVIFLLYIENLIFHDNFLSGQIPNVFQKMQSLDYLDASNNLFTGSIPETIFEVASLRLLYLSNNTISGSIPPEYSKPTFLRDLYLDGNVLVGTVPDITNGQLVNLNEFLVHFNFLSGSMPGTVCTLRASGGLENLFSDCGGQSPEIDCEFPGCCNRCFEGGSTTER